MTAQVSLSGLTTVTRRSVVTRRGGDSLAAEGRAWRRLLHSRGPAEFIDVARAHERARMPAR